MKDVQLLDKIVFFLLLIGGLNWGLIGLFNFNLVYAIFSFMPIIARIIYVLVGIAAVYRFYLWAKISIENR